MSEPEPESAGVRQTRSHLMRMFGERGLHPRSDLGQNFLIDLNSLEFVVQQAELTRDDVVLEVGAGTGGMTTFLASSAAHVVSVEIDRRMYEFASAAAAPFTNITLLNVDALESKHRLSEQVLEEVRRRLDEASGRRLKLVANLPYSVATPVVSNLVATDLPWVRMVITIQYELAQRMTALPRDSHYGALSVWLQSQCRLEILRKLGPTVFWPRPKVDSAVVRIDPDPARRGKLPHREEFHEFIRRLFQQRRKRLRGVLVGMYAQARSKAEIDATLAKMSFAESARAEELTVETLVELFHQLRLQFTNPDYSRVVPPGDTEARRNR